MDEKAQLGINLEKEVQHTPNEIMQQMIDALITAVHLKMITGETAATMVEITRELLHWGFMKPGTHNTPAELLSEIAAVSSFGPAGIGKDGKPKIDA